MNEQTELFTTSTAADAVRDAEQRELRGALQSAGGWMTRAQLCRFLNWPERKLREVAESMGPDIVRCQLGFKLTELINRDDLPDVKQAIDAFHSQARKMDVYADSLRRRLHRLIG
jgi:hypothetical protein